MKNLVAVEQFAPAIYPPPPYHPSAAYPEFGAPGGRLSPALATAPNPVFDGVRRLLLSLGLDQASAGTPSWNPLGEWIRPGDRVLIKPNLVRHYHPYGYDCASIVTHGSVLRAICDYALLAAGRHGRIVIADAPLQSCDFAEVVKLAGLDHLSRHYASQGIDIPVRDLRLVRTTAERASWFGKVLVQAENPGDPAGYTHVDLGARSAHAETGADSTRYRVTCYDPTRMSRHHGGGRHEYVVANSLLEADVVINVPKLKTHQKAGLTAALKNFVGINGHKDCLPHHIKGAYAEGGDEYRTGNWAKQADSWLLDAREQTSSTAARKAAAVAHRVLESVHRREGFWQGSWYGNETIARTTIDLNRIVRYAMASGELADQPQRRLFSIVDGVIAGDRDGPLAPSPRPVGVVMAGADPVAVDMAAARVMGFRYRAIPTLRLALDGASGFRLASCEEAAVRMVSSDTRWHGLAPGDPTGPSLAFHPHDGWKGHIEL